jgi:tetratricopeptide (TPR) repeat protein
MNPAEFLTRYRAAKRQTAHQILGLSLACSRDQARTAYRKMVRQFHPDRFTGEPYRYLQKEVNDFFVRINQAYEAVHQCAAQLEEPELAPSAPAYTYNFERRQAKAKQHFLRGLLLIQERNFAEALQFFELAIEQDPGPSQYHAQAAGAMLQTPLDSKAKKRRVEILLKTSIVRDPSDPTNFYQLGRMLKERGDIRNSTRLFACAVVLKPDYHEAQREVRLLQMRRERELSQSGGGPNWLKRLLKAEETAAAGADKSQTRSWQTDRRKLVSRRIEQVPIPFPDRRMADRRREIRRLSDLPIDKILSSALES